MPSMINVEWLNQNSGRAYPFQEDMLRRPTIDGAKADYCAIPNGLLVDFVIATNFDTQPSVYLSSLTVAGTTVTAVVSDVSDGTPLGAFTAAVSSEDYSPVNFSGLGVHDDIRGTAVFGNLPRCLESYPDGVYSFEPGETTFEARCVRPSVPCVSGLFISSSTGSYESKRLRGDVALIAGQNVRLEFNEKDNAIIIHADARYGLNDKCDCEARDNRRQIMSVNGVSSSELEIEGGDCVKVEKREGRIIISDTCSKPCCGCAELTFLNEKTNMITTSIVKLDQFSQQLGFKLDEFERNVLLANMKNATYM